MRLVCKPILAFSQYISGGVSHHSSAFDFGHNVYLSVLLWSCFAMTFCQYLASATGFNLYNIAHISAAMGGSSEMPP